MDDNQSNLAVIPRPKRGRPPAISVNPEIKTQIIELIKQGNYVSTAMVALGLDDDFYYHCLDQAKKGQKDYCEFVRQLKKAEAEAEIDALSKMRSATNWIPHATFLERRHRLTWGRSDKHQIEANVNIRVEMTDYSKLAKAVNKR